jgi:hypothetical protein
LCPSFSSHLNSLGFSQEFKERLNKEDEKFREPIITFINDAVGTHTWAIQFEQSGDEKTFGANIYCENEEDYEKIVSIIQERIIDVDIIPNFSGRLTEYIGFQ